MASAVMFKKPCSFNGKVSEAAEKKESCQERAKCELVGFDLVPEYLQDNEFILDYYRSEWPLKETILSVFSIHNETLNIWTHLIGFFIFLALTIFAVSMFPTTGAQFVGGGSSSTQFQVNASMLSTCNLGYAITLPLTSSYYNIIPQIASNNSSSSSSSTSTSDHQLGREPVARWPFFAFLFGAMVCLLASSACHLLMCHSEQCAYKMLRLDYTGIATLIVTSFYPLVYYTFTCDPFLCRVYISFITLFGLATVLVFLIPVFQTPEFRLVRSMLFACMAVSGLVPILHKVVVYGDRPEAIVTAQYELVMMAFYGVGVVIYAARVPERWMPGKFDLVGHSHQLFHVLVVAGAYTHYLAGLEYLKWREMEGC